MAPPQEYVRPSNACTKNSVVKVMIGKMETYIDFEVSVKQGGIIASALFLFNTMSFYETLIDE